MRILPALFLVAMAACGPGEDAAQGDPGSKPPATALPTAERLRRAQDLLVRERLAEAAAEYQAALAQDGKNVPALEGLSRIAGRMNDVQGSLRLITRAAELSPEDASILNQLGVAQLSCGRKQEAAKTFERAMAINPQDPLVLLNAAQNQADLGDWAKARQHAEKAAALIPEDATPWLLMGRFQMRQGKFGEAVAPLREAARLAPDQALIQYNLGKALASSGRRQEAEVPLRAALRSNPPPDIRKEVEDLLAGK